MTASELQAIREAAQVWHANEIFRRDWHTEGGVLKGAIVEWKRGDQFSSNHAEAFINVVLATDFAAQSDEVRRLREALKSYGFHDACCATEHKLPCDCGFEAAIGSQP